MQSREADRRMACSQSLGRAKSEWNQCSVGKAGFMFEFSGTCIPLAEDLLSPTMDASFDVGEGQSVGFVFSENRMRGNIAPMGIDVEYRFEVSLPCQ